MVINVPEGPIESASGDRPRTFGKIKKKIEEKGKKRCQKHRNCLATRRRDSKALDKRGEKMQRTVFARPTKGLGDRTKYCRASKGGGRKK